MIGQRGAAGNFLNARERREGQFESLRTDFGVGEV